MKKSLYEISAELERLNESLIEAGGEVTPETENQLVILEADLQTKASNYGLVILSNRHDIESVDAEIKRLTEKKRFMVNANQRLEDAVSAAMQRFSLEEIKTPIVKLNFRASESVEIFDQAALPAEFLTEKITYTPDKAAIKSAIKNGSEIPGATLLTNRNLQIK